MAATADEDSNTTTAPHASTISPPTGKDGVSVPHAAATSAGGGGVEEPDNIVVVEEEEKVNPKVSGKNNTATMDTALRAQRSGGQSSPYAKPMKQVLPNADTVIPSNKRIYIGNLSWEVTWRELKDHITACGLEVVRADVLMGNDGRSRGCGVVELATVEEAMSAIGGLHDTELMGRKIFVREDREDGGGGSGNNNYNSNRNNNHMNNNMNRNAAVSRGGYVSGGGYGGGGGGGGNVVPVGRSVYVGNLSYETAWQDLKDHMRSAGDVLHAEVMTMSDGRSKGCGIVEYATTESAARAIAELNDSELMGRQIFVREDREGGGNNKAGGGGGRGGGVGGVSGAREGDGGYLAGPYHAAGFGGGGGRGNVGNNLSVYVGNLPYETTWQELKDHMRAAGNVDKADILKGPDGRSKGCGIVLYQKSHEVARAIRELQNSLLHGRPILVREDREHGNNGGGGGYPYHHHQQQGYNNNGNRGFHHGGYNNNNNNNGGGGGYQNKYYQQQQQQHNHHMSPSRGYIPGGFGGAPPQPPQSSSSSNMNVVVEPGCQLYIGNLSWETGWQELKDYFRQCGDVERSEVAEGNDGRKRGFGIIRYRTAREAMNAIETLNGVEFMGRPLEVRLDNRA